MNRKENSGALNSDVYNFLGEKGSGQNIKSGNPAKLPL